MPTKGQRRRRTADYINVRLSATDDADLIAWWKALPDGAGAAQVRRAIRQYLAAGDDTPTATRDDVGQAASWAVDELGRRQAETQRLIVALSAQIDALKGQIAAGVSINAAAPAPALPEAVPALTPDEQRARLKKVVSQKW